jgi:S-adenosylmethionine:tRNA ribosyltransferase-isomerase
MVYDSEFEAINYYSITLAFILTSVNSVKRSDFYFDLPESLIAFYPTPERPQSRLLCLDTKSGEIAHRHFYDVIDLIQPGDVLVLNNTKVLPARLYGRKASGGKIEILVERLVNQNQAWAHCKASKRPPLYSQLIFDGNVLATVLKDQQGLLLLRFDDARNIINILDSHGHIPLPPYIRRDDEALDRERYQTVFAKHAGSVAAPTAGLHFDEALLKKLHDKGVEVAYVTLHVGAGTFQPMRVEHLDEHVMHSEYAVLPEDTCEKIKTAKQQGKRVIAVGTTTVRTLETAALSGEIKPFSDETNIFIKPGFEFKCVDAMITNFHLPESTLLMLVCAFAGYENTMSAYRTAVTEKYRFFSYGDAVYIAGDN